MKYNIWKLTDKITQAKHRQQTNMHEIKIVRWLIVFVMTCIGCSVGQDPENNSIKNQQISVDLGDVQAGQQVTGTVEITNSKSEPLVITSFESSCPCLEVEPVPLQVDGNSKRRVDLKFDSSHDPEFRGRLSIELKGIPQRALESAFEARVHVNVVEKRDRL